MTERLLNTLLVLSVVITIAGAVFLPNGPSYAELPWGIRIAQGVVFGAAGIFTIMKIASSRFFLLVLNDQSLSKIKEMYIVGYVLFTKEAREEWRSLISKRKEKVGHSHTEST
jgi:hypothetical protein